MQVFVPYSSPLRCAMVLDQRRLNKQIIECRQILKAIRGESSAWFNHPCVNMYRKHELWLVHYTRCLELYKSAQSLKSDDFDEALIDLDLARAEDRIANDDTPYFLTDAFCEQHQRRLYTKNPSHYPQFAHLGTSEENWYCLDGDLVRYLNGKRV